MKKFSGFIVLFLALALGVNAQGGQRLEKRIEAQRIAFMTNKLNLSPEESQSFWPIYNEYKGKEKELERSYKPDNPFKLMSDEEINTHIDRQLEKEEKLLQLKKTCIQKLRQTLPVRKVAMIPRVERQFKELMLRKIKERRNGGDN